jgi:hypothetical protein
MKTIDDFVQQHGGMFDNEEPRPGHEDRFRSRLNTMHSTRRPGLKVVLFRVAAILVL